MTTPGDWMPVLRVLDLDRSVEFYARVIGFSVGSTHEDEVGARSVMLVWGPSRLMLSTGEHLGGAPSFTGALYLSVTGVDELWNRVNRSAEVVWPLEKMDYGTREFGVRDLDGYVLAFAEDVD